jgi:hypothetical protein
MTRTPSERLAVVAVVVAAIAVAAAFLWVVSLLR